MSTNDTNAVMLRFASSMLMLFVALPLTSLWSGYVLATLWGWLMVPTFGFPAITLLQAIGVSLVASFLTHQWDDYLTRKVSPSESWKRIATWGAVRPLVVLCAGWLLHSFM